LISVPIRAYQLLLHIILFLNFLFSLVFEKFDARLGLFAKLHQLFITQRS